MKKKFATMLSALVVASTLTVTTVNAQESTAEVQFQPGLLNINSADNFAFGKPVVSSAAMSLPNSDGLSVNLEDETGTGDGWNLKASLSDFEVLRTGEELPETVLEGASINLAGATGTSTLDGAAVTGVNTVDAIELSAGSAEDVVIASADANADLAQAGVGPWTLNWTADNTTLDIPATKAFSTADGETVTATVTWTMASGPSGDVAQQ